MKTFFTWTLCALISTPFFGCQTIPEVDQSRVDDLRTRLSKNFVDIEAYLKGQGFDAPTISSMKSVMVEDALSKIIKTTGPKLTGQKNGRTLKESYNNQLFIVGPFEPLSSLAYYWPSPTKFSEKANITEEQAEKAWGSLYSTSELRHLSAQWMVGSWSQFAWDLYNNLKESHTQADLALTNQLRDVANFMNIPGSSDLTLYDLGKIIASKIEGKKTDGLTPEHVNKQHQKVTTLNVFTQSEEEWQDKTKKAAAIRNKIQAEIAQLKKDISALQSQLCSKSSATTVSVESEPSSAQGPSEPKPSDQA